MQIIVTDLTRFRNQGLVCLAGINPETGECVRPFFTNNNGGTDYLQFQSVKDHRIIPGSYLEGDFSRIANLARPHTEDHRIVGTLRTSGNATGDEFQRVLEASSSTTVAGGFGALPMNKFYGLANPPPISIFTLKLTSPRTQFSLIADCQYGPAVFKAHITDAAGHRISFLKVTDLGFSDHIQKIQAEDPGLRELNAFFQAQDMLYLRIGLGRAFAPNDDQARNGYWPQLNGIYSFPNFRQDMRIYD